MTPEGRNFGLEVGESIKKPQISVGCEHAGAPECPGIVVNDMSRLAVECLREKCLHPLRNTSPYRGIHDTAGNVDPNFKIAMKPEDMQ